MEKQRDRLKAFRKRKKAERDAANKPKTTKPKAETSQVRAASRPDTPSGTGTRKPPAKPPTSKPQPPTSKPKPRPRGKTPSTDSPIMSSSSTYTGDRRGNGTYGKPLPSNPQLKSPPKKKKPVKSRGVGVKDRTPTKRRGRLSPTERRRARRSSR